MSTEKKGYEEPEFEKDAFHCPYCDVHSKMKWEEVKLLTKVVSKLGGGEKEVHSVKNPPGREKKEESLHLSYCQNCNNYMIWRKEEMIHPLGKPPPSNEGLPEDIKEIYEEAGEVKSISLKSAAALLRLALEKLLEHLEVEGDRLYDKIGNLVEEGEVNPELQQMMDTVRITGNEAVHQGTIILDENPENVDILFFMINEITDEMITKPKKIEDVYEKLPDRKKEGIENRDEN